MLLVTTPMETGMYHELRHLIYPGDLLTGIILTSQRFPQLDPPASYFGLVSVLQVCIHVVNVINVDIGINMHIVTLEHNTDFVKTAMLNSLLLTIRRLNLNRTLDSNYFL